MSIVVDNSLTSKGRPVVRTVLSVVSITACLLFVLAACSQEDSAAPGSGSGGTIPGLSGTGGIAGGGIIPEEGASGQPTGGVVQSGTGGVVQTGTGGVVQTGTGGVVQTGTGGVVQTGTGGVVQTGTGGVVQTGTGGVIEAGTGGMVTGGTGGGVLTPKACAMEDYSVPCTSVIVPDTNAELQLGPYGSVMDVNKGVGFETGGAALVAGEAAFCPAFVAMFGQPVELTDRLLDLHDNNMDLHTVFRPAIMGPDEKFPLIVWGNGTCAQPGGYGTLLHYIASHGFFIVAPNNREVGGGAMIVGLDYAFATNDDPNSEYYQRMDLTKVGAMGHSQGGAATVATANDPRVKAVILWNGGSSASKPFLGVSGDNDIGGIAGGSASAYQLAVNAAPKAAFLYYHKIPPCAGMFCGHVTLMMQPERVIEPALAWWQMIFNDDPVAREMFVGANCGLCNQAADFEFGQNGL